MTDKGKLELAAEATPGERQGGLLGRLKRGLAMTHGELLDRLSARFEGRVSLDEDTLEHLEELLIGADLGVETSLELVDRLRREARGFAAGDVVKLRQMLVDEVAILLLDAQAGAWSEASPRVTLTVGVNGVGKTTSIAKLARRSQQRDESVLLVAADTFRAAAGEQLGLWGERLGVEVIGGVAEADPAAVIFDALQAAGARRIDHVVVDTAGRLHTKGHLMAELAKCKRVIDREASDWTRQTLLVLDSTTGQNAVTQAREFTRAVSVDGLLLAKLDGTAKGGVVVAVARELRLPVVFLGVGEAADDLVEFRPREFAAALLG